MNRPSSDGWRQRPSMSELTPTVIGSNLHTIEASERLMNSTAQLDYLKKPLLTYIMFCPTHSDDIQHLILSYVFAITSISKSFVVSFFVRVHLPVSQPNISIRVNPRDLSNQVISDGT